MGYFFSADSHTLLCANHKMMQGNLSSCANISLLQAISCCVHIINDSKVIFYRAGISLPHAIRYCMLTMYCSK